MKLVTTDFISGQEIDTICLVHGSCVQTAHFGKDFFNGLKTLVGDELSSYTKMMEQSRETATERMIKEALLQL